MKTPPVPESDLETLLDRAFRDDLPPDTEARMNRHFVELRRTLDQLGPETDVVFWRHWFFRKELLAFASAIMLILGAILHLSGYQSVLANSVSKLKVLVEVSSSLGDVISMDCALTRPEAGGEASRFRVRWSANGVTRVDRHTIGGVKQTLWISNTNVAPDPAWQPAMEFLLPIAIAKNMENRYGLMQTGPDPGPDEFLLTGQDKNKQVVEVIVDEKTFLPKMLKKYAPRRTGEGRDCLIEVRFLWNQPIPEQLLQPRPLSAEKKGQ